MTAPEEKKTNATAEQLKLLTKITLGYKAAAVNTQDLAGDAVRMWGMLNIVRHGKPAAGEPSRTVYDQAVQSFGKSGAAAQKLLQTLMESLDALSTKVHTEMDAGANASSLRNILIVIQSEMHTVNPYFAEYSAYRSMSEKIATLKSALGRKEAWVPGTAAFYTPSAATGVTAAKAVEEPEPEISAEQGRITMIRGLDFGRMHYLQFKGGAEFYSMGGTPTFDQIALFGTGADNETNAQKFVSALGYSIAANNNGRNQTQALASLKDVMGKITNTDVLSNASYADALYYLNNNKRPSDGKVLTDAERLAIVVNDLNNQSLGSLMNGIYSTANNMAVVTVDQKAITLYTARATVALDVLGSMDQFLTYLGTPGTQSFGRAVISLAMSVAYDYLNVTGELITTNAGQPTGTATRLTGYGQSASITPQAVVSSSLGATPVQIVLHCNLGYEKVVMPTIRARSPTGDVEQSTPQKEDMYVGIYGIEMRFPGHFGATSPIRFERVGAGGLGGQGAFALATLSYTPYQTDKTTVQLLATPAYLGILNLAKAWTSRPSLELGARWERQAKAQLLSIDPSVKVEYDATGQTWNVDVGAGVTYKPSATWDFTVRGGAVGDIKGGITSRKIPNLGYISADLTAYLGAPKRAATSSLVAVPTKLSAPPQWNDSVMAAYINATEYGARKKGETTVEETAKVARELAGLIEGQTLETGSMKTITRMGAYKDAIASLRLGDLKKGLSLLKQAGLF